MTVGDRIRLRRKEIGLTVDQVADALGKNRATVYRYESDEIENMPIGVLEPLAKVLQTTPAHLMGWDEDIQTIAAHHEGNDWTEEELEEIEKFKEFVRMKKQKA